MQIFRWLYRMWSCLVQMADLPPKTDTRRQWSRNAEPWEGYMPRIKGHGAKRGRLRLY
jgi:hypothetical protein